MNKIKVIEINSFSKNSLQYIFGISLAQLIAFSFQFLLRRIYSKEEFGYYAIFTSIVSLITVISTLRYERAILIPKENNKAYRLFVTAIFFAVCINTILLLIITLLHNTIANIFNITEKNSGFLYLIPVSGILFSIFRVFEFYLTRQKKYFQLGSSKVVRRLTEGIFQYLFKFSNKVGLFTGDIIGHSINFIYGVLLIKKDLIRFKKEPIKLKQTIIEYSDFPKYNLLTAVAQDLNAVFLPVLLISHFFGTETTGIYDLARLLLSVPLALITVAIQQVLFQRLSISVGNNHNILPKLIKLFRTLFIAGIIGTILFLLFIDKIFLLFGPDWKESIDIARILVYSYLIKFVLEPFSAVFYALRKLKIYSIWQTIYFLFILLLFLFKYQSIYQLLLIIVIIDISFYILLGIFSLISVYFYQKELKEKNNAPA